MAAALQQQLQISGKNNQVGELDLQEQFPAGMRVLVVDDDPTCLRVLEGLLRKCSYRVTTCGKATVALSMLRENRDNFDLVISDVYMPDMDGFKLLELVGLEMDLPVIMMSANGETSAVMKGITHGACDYLLKPVRIEELRNIWQHVVRKKRTETKDMDHSGSVEDERPRRGSDDGDHTSSVNDVSEGNWKISKKRKEEEDNDHESDDPSTLKKQRVVWSVELHQQFVSAVNKLGIDKAVPKRILELMNVQGLTRENVASHLQKYRLYLRRLSGVGHQQQNMGSSFPGTSESSFGHVNSLEGLGDLRALAASGQLSQHALATLQSGLLGRINSTNGVRVGGVDPNMILQMQGGNTYLGRSVNSSFTGASLPCLTGGSDLDHFSQVHQMPTLNPMMVEPINDGGVSALQQQYANAGGISALTSIAGDNEGLATNVNSNPLMQVVQQQQTQPRLITGSGAFSHNNMLSDDLSGGHQSQLGNINTNMDNFPNLESIAQGLGDGGPSSFTANLGSHCREIAGSTSSFISSSIVRGSGHSVDDNAFENRNDGLHAPSRALGTKMNGLANHREMPQGWQLPVRNQTHWQSQSSMQSPRYASSHQTMNNLRAHNTGLMLSGSIFSSRFPGEGGPIKSSAVDCNGEQSTAESSYKLTEGQSNLPNVKLEGGMDNGSTTSDDLLSLFLKQQQEGMVFGESDLANDGYLLDKLYVK